MQTPNKITPAWGRVRLAYRRTRCRFLSCMLLVGSLVGGVPIRLLAVGDQYPVVLTGVRELYGVSISSVEAFARHGSTWQRVALQIDEVNKRGDFVLAEGIPFTKNTDDRLYDDNDELVFSGSDLGEDFSPSDVPLNLRHRESITKSWKLTMRRQQQVIGWLLVIVRPQHWQHTAAGDMAAKTAASWRPQADFSRDQGVVSSSIYQYHFSKKNPALLGQVVLRQERNDALKSMVPVIQDSQFIMPLRTPWYMPNLSFTSADFTSEIECWQVGPLRTIVAVGVKYTSFLSLFKLHLFSELIFYRNKFEIPTRIEFVFDPSKYLKPGSGIAYALTFPPGHHWQIESNLIPLPPVPADALVAKTGTAVQTPVFYARGASDEGAFFVQVKVDEAARRQVPPPAIFHKAAFTDKSLRQSWAWLEKLQGDLGVYLDFANVKKGSYDFGLDLLLSSKAHESFTDYGLVTADWQAVPL